MPPARALDRDSHWTAGAGNQSYGPGLDDRLSDFDSTALYAARDQRRQHLQHDRRRSRFSRVVHVHGFRIPWQARISEPHFHKLPHTHGWYRHFHTCLMSSYGSGRTANPSVSGTRARSAISARKFAAWSTPSLWSRVASRTVSPGPPHWSAQPAVIA